MIPGTPAAVGMACSPTRDTQVPPGLECHRLVGAHQSYPRAEGKKYRKLFRFVNGRSLGP